MKTNKTVSFIFILLILSSPTIFSKPPIIEIKLSKSVYLESETIPLEIEVRIDKEIKLDKLPVISPPGDVKFILTNENGDTVEHISGSYSQVASKSQHLEYYYIIYDILSI